MSLERWNKLPWAKPPMFENKIPMAKEPLEISIAKNANELVRLEFGKQLLRELLSNGLIIKLPNSLQVYDTVGVETILRVFKDHNITLED